MVGGAGLFVEIVRLPLNRVGGSACATAPDVHHPPGLAALVIVNVSGDLNDLGFDLLLLRFEEGAKVMFLRTRGVTCFFIGVRVRRMMQQDENEVGCRWNVAEL